jgi:hypothetical protein
MPTAHVVVTKRIQYQGQPEEFSNGYNFQLGTNDLDEALAEQIADAVWDVERLFHATNVSRVYSVVGLLNTPAIWSRTDNPGSFNGSKTPTDQHPEVCVMAESKKRNKVYLRKFFHTGAHHGGDTNNRDSFGGADATEINAAMVKLTDGTMPGGVQACFPDGSLATVPFTCDPYLRTHQFRRRGRRPLTP